jgi:hypothetical protein
MMIELAEIWIASSDGSIENDFVRFRRVELPDGWSCGEAAIALGECDFGRRMPMFVQQQPAASIILRSSQVIGELVP